MLTSAIALHGERSTVRRSLEGESLAGSACCWLAIRHKGCLAALLGGTAASGLPTSPLRQHADCSAGPPAMSALKKLIPTLDRVLVSKLAAPTTTAGGVLLPESAVSKVGLRRTVPVVFHV